MAATRTGMYVTFYPKYVFWYVFLSALVNYSTLLLVVFTIVRIWLVKLP